MEDMIAQLQNLMAAEGGATNLPMDPASAQRLADEGSQLPGVIDRINQIENQLYEGQVPEDQREGMLAELSSLMVQWGDLDPSIMEDDGASVPSRSMPITRDTPAPTGAAQLGGYDPVRQDMMEKTYAHDPAVGDPSISVGMDPFRVNGMGAQEREVNMGSYDTESDAIYLNQDLSKRDMTDTAKHEFRHRGNHIMDEEDGAHPPDHTLEEMVMLMNDMGQGIGDDSYNIPALRGLVQKGAKQTLATPNDMLEMADTGATNYNAAARAKMGGGAQYASPLQSLIELMGNRGQ